MTFDFRVFQIVVDIFFGASLYYLIPSIGSKGVGFDEDRIKKLAGSLKEQVKAANSAIDRVSTETERSANASKEALKELDAKGIEIHAYLEKIDALLKGIDETLSASSDLKPKTRVAPKPKPQKTTKPKKQGPEPEIRPEIKYEEASKLVDEGYEIEDIVKRVGLPKGEVELILGLKRSEK